MDVTVAEMKSFLDTEANSGELLPDDMVEQIIRDADGVLSNQASLKLKWSMINFAVSQIHGDSSCILEWIVRIWKHEESLKYSMHFQCAERLAAQFLQLHQNRKYGAEKMLKKIAELIQMVFDVLGEEVGDSFYRHFSVKLIENCNAGGEGQPLSRLIATLFSLLPDPRYPSLLAIALVLYEWTGIHLKKSGTQQHTAKVVQLLGAMSSAASRYVGSTSVDGEIEYRGERHGVLDGQHEDEEEVSSSSSSQKCGGHHASSHARHLARGKRWHEWHGSCGAENATCGAARRFLELKFHCPSDASSSSASFVPSGHDDDDGENSVARANSTMSSSKQAERSRKRSKVMDPSMEYEAEMDRLRSAVAHASAQRLVALYHHSKDVMKPASICVASVLQEQALKAWPIAHFPVPAHDGLTHESVRIRVLTLQKLSQWYELRAKNAANAGAAPAAAAFGQQCSRSTQQQMAPKLVHSIVACAGAPAFSTSHPSVRKQVAVFTEAHLPSMAPHLTWQHYMHLTLMFAANSSSSSSDPPPHSSSSSSSKSSKSSSDVSQHARRNNIPSSSAVRCMTMDACPVLMNALAWLRAQDLVQLLNAHPDPAVLQHMIITWAKTKENSTSSLSTLTVVTQRLVGHFFDTKQHEVAKAVDRVLDVVMMGMSDAAIKSCHTGTDTSTGPFSMPRVQCDGFISQLLCLTISHELTAPTRCTVFTVLRKIFQLGVKLPDAVLTTSELFRKLCDETQVSEDLHTVRCIIQLLHVLHDTNVTDAGTAEAYAMKLYVSVQRYFDFFNYTSTENYLKPADAVLPKLYAMTCFIEACSPNTKLMLSAFELLTTLFRRNEDHDVRRRIIEAQTPLYRCLSVEIKQAEDMFSEFVANELTWAFKSDLDVGLESALALVEDAEKQGDGAKVEMLSRLTALANERFDKDPRAVVSFLGVFLERGIIFPSDYMLDGKLTALLIGDTRHSDLALRYLKLAQPRHVAHGFLVGRDMSYNLLKAGMCQNRLRGNSVCAGQEKERVANILELIHHFDIKGRTIIGQAMLRCLESGADEYIEQSESELYFKIVAIAMAQVSSWNGKVLEDWCSALTSTLPQTKGARVLHATSVWMCQLSSKRDPLPKVIQVASALESEKDIMQWWSDMRDQVVELDTTTSTKKRRRYNSETRTRTPSVCDDSMRE